MCQQLAESLSTKLAVVPGDTAADLLTALDATVAANETMSAFHQEHQARFVG